MAMLLLRFTPGGSFIKFNFIVFQPGSHIHFQMVTYKLKNKIQIKLHRQKLHIALLSHLDTDLEADHIINAFNIKFTNSPYLITNPHISTDQLCTTEFGNNKYFIPLAIGRTGYRIQ
jgi:hypothetical protein